MVRQTKRNGSAISKTLTYLTAAVLTFTLLAARIPSWPVLAVQSESRSSAEEMLLAGETAERTDAAAYTAYRVAADGWAFAVKESTADMAPTRLTVGSSVQFQMETSLDLLYELHLYYRSLVAQDTVLTILIDGQLPFTEAERLIFPAMWVNDGDVRRDTMGNEFAPEQILYDGLVTAAARDYTGRQEDPYRFALTAGIHTITLSVKQGSLYLESAAFAAPEQPTAYQAPQGEFAAVEDYIILKGEEAFLKSDHSLIALADNSSTAVHPSSATYSKLNYIGGANWDAPGSAISWRFDVKIAGYYTVGFDYRQNQLLGGGSFRHLAIDGKTPFEQAKRIKFPYDSTWRHMIFGEENEKYRIWLDAGSHVLTLTATPGPMADIYADMQKIAARMGELYVDIIMIAGETIDVYRSYELFNQIPGFNETLRQIIEELDTVAEQLEAMQETKSGSTVSTVRNAQRVVQQMLDKPYSAHRYKSAFYDAYTNISVLMGTMANMPLDIDRIVLLGEGAEGPHDSPSFMDTIRFSLDKFLNTFFRDYRNVSDKAKGEALTLWIGWGRDQAQVLNALIQDSFVRETGIPVKVELANATLIQATLSGEGPDCMLQMQRTEPVNLAMRGALLDLMQFKDVDETLQRFSGGAEIPYRYRDGLYALPDTQSFFMLFMRTDIMESMGLKIPQTWDEFIYTAMLLQRSNLQVSLPYTKVTDSGTSNSGVGGLGLYPTLLAQDGLAMYYADHSGCTMGEIKQMQKFTEWVGWYTRYKLPVITDFFNRFRIGSAPIGITSSSMYTQLKAAAPEIDGCWTVTEIPGTRQEDGTIVRSSAGSGTGCAITSLSKNPKNAWEFLKWWTSASTQVKYSQNVESVLGPLGRVSTANKEALQNLGWDEDMKQLLKTVQESVQELPEVPGGYYTARGLDQAFWSVVEQGETPNDALTRWAAIVNREIQRKTAQYAKR